MAAVPMKIFIDTGVSSNGHFEPPVPVPGGTSRWMSTGPSSFISGKELADLLNQGVNVEISTPGKIFLEANVVVDSDKRLSLIADEIYLARGDILGRKLNLTLTARDADMGGTAKLKIGGLHLAVKTRCHLGQDASSMISSIDGMTDGSNIVLKNTEFGKDTHWFNGNNLSQYIPQYEAAPNEKSSHNAASAKTADKTSTISSAASTVTTSTAAAAVASNAAAAPSTQAPTSPSMTVAFNTTTAQNPDKTGTDAVAKSNQNSGSHKAKK